MIASVTMDNGVSLNQHTAWGPTHQGAHDSSLPVANLEGHAGEGGGGGRKVAGSSFSGLNLTFF